ncbi:MAG: hypothetical protein M0C28_11355 [Candidatus Moduliflexus flocculans]|nr:hypothetical protein [Candidatus Moduliflexus flocculans]
MTEESYDRVMNINLKGPVFFAQKIAKGDDLAETDRSMITSPVIVFVYFDFSIYDLYKQG